MDASQKMGIEVSNDGDQQITGVNQVPINVLSSGQGSTLEIINQYGQLLGGYSKLDDELWLSCHEEDQSVAICNEDLQIHDISSREHAVNLEPLLKSVDISSVKNNSLISKTSSENQSKTLSPEIVLERRPYSNATRKHSQNKPHRSENHCGYSPGDADHSEYAESLLMAGVEDSVLPEQVRTRKLSDLLKLPSGMKSQNATLDLAQEINLNIDPVKTCMHCESSMTPQWRDGPMGPKSLCNACGIQFKFGRLSADYRPLRSPTFDPSRHTKLAKTKKKKMDYSNLNPTPCLKRSSDMKLVDHREIDQNCTPKAESDHGVAEKTVDLLESGSGLCTNLLKAKRMKLDNSMEGYQDATPSKKKTEEMRILVGGETYQNGTLQSSCIQAIADGSIELVESGSTSWKVNGMPKKIPKKKLPKQRVKKCLHCESTRTPQWRLGPMGRNTLCNACGVQHKHGRLFPEYRPLKSPTFNPSLHSHLPKKVLEMRNKISEERAIGGDSEKPVPSNSFTHLFRVH